MWGAWIDDYGRERDAEELDWNRLRSAMERTGNLEVEGVAFVFDLERALLALAGLMMLQLDRAELNLPHTEGQEGPLRMGAHGAARRHQRGQHSGLREAGAKLVEIAKVGKEITELPDSDLGRRAELIELLVRLAVA